jgi:8-oxo-dGTP pyrophosphatase MutT (NUDIX family)
VHPVCAKQSPSDKLKLKQKRKPIGRAQIAALPIQVTLSPVEIMLITSRETGRWIIPKGWPQKGRKAHEVAEREAFEEAGVVGRAAVRSIGRYWYEKRLTAGRAIICDVTVFLLRVERQLAEWPEKADRERCWLTPLEAAARVEEQGLRELLRNVGVRYPTFPSA